MTKCSSFRICFHEKKFILSNRKCLKSGRKREEECIKCKLETVFPFLDTLIFVSCLIECGESRAGLIVCHPNESISYDFDTIDFSGESYIIEIYPSPGGQEIIFELEFTIAPTH